MVVEEAREVRGIGKERQVQRVRERDEDKGRDISFRSLVHRGILLYTPTQTIYNERRRTERKRKEERENTDCSLIPLHWNPILYSYRIPVFKRGTQRKREKEIAPSVALLPPHWNLPSSSYTIPAFKKETKREIDHST